MFHLGKQFADWPQKCFMGLLLPIRKAFFALQQTAQAGQVDLPHLSSRGRLTGPTLGFFPVTPARWEEEEHVSLQ
jgi:hypothetical protein